MKIPTRYGLSVIAIALLFAPSLLQARPIGFSELSLLVRMREPEFSIKNEVAERKLLHGLTQPQENILKSQGASDSLIKSLRDSNLVASKEEVAAVESAAHETVAAPSAEIQPAEHHHHVLVFDVAFGHPINLSQWGGLDYEVAFYSYRFAGEDHIQPALVDQVGTRTVVSRSIPLESEGEALTDNWFPTNGARNWRYTPYSGVGYDGRGDFRDSRLNWSDSVAASEFSVSRPISVDWDDPVFFDGQPYTFYRVYGAGGVSLYYISANSYSARVAVAFNR
ncbi:MAG TPA: hypothetical protein VLK27_05090 [Chthoniobacterales bacterium]|nr:hypothetical protein [Chthoniobacterales bacterium]